MKILIADDDPIACRILEQAVGRLGHEPVVAGEGDAAWSLFRRDAPDVVISDWFMPGLDGLELCRRVRASPGQSYVYIILVTGTRSRGNMPQAMEAGADDFLVKPVDPEELTVRLNVASRITTLYRRTAHAEERAAALEEHLRPAAGIEGMIGGSEPMRDVIRRLRLAAQSEVTTLLTGESGTGKELGARALHTLSARKSGPFLAVNCGALPETLLESELFGHVKGAFTGAHQNKAGLFEAASGGTLFMDEIGDVTPALQLKVLRALQEREIRRVGDAKTAKVDVRIVAATNKDLRKLVAEGAVRQDFFYRIRVFEIVLPPLRDRKDDLLALASHFLEEMAASRAQPVRSLSHEALRLLMDYDWPGNIRELRNALEHALVVVEGDVIQPQDLPVELRSPGRRSADSADGGGAEERSRILDALQRTGGSRVEAARQLGISRVTLWKKLKRLGIDPEA
jgi:two-component system response regulator HydG